MKLPVDHTTDTLFIWDTQATGNVLEPIGFFAAVEENAYAEAARFAAHCKRPHVLTRGIREALAAFDGKGESCFNFSPVDFMQRAQAFLKKELDLDGIRENLRSRSVDDLNRAVTNAIFEAEHEAPGSVESQKRFREVALIEEELATRHEAETIEGAVARLGVVTALLSADEPRLALKAAELYQSQDAGKLTRQHASKLKHLLVEATYCVAQKEGFEFLDEALRKKWYRIEDRFPWEECLKIFQALGWKFEGKPPGEITTDLLRASARGTLESMLRDLRQAKGPVAVGCGRFVVESDGVYLSFRFVPFGGISGIVE